MKKKRRSKDQKSAGYKARLIYADSERSADLYYATQFFAPDPFLYLKDLTGESHLVTSGLEIDRARRVAQVDHVHDWSDIRKQFKKKKPEKKINLINLMTFFLKKEKIKQLEVPQDFPVGLADKLRQKKIKISAVEGAFWPERAIKNSREVKCLEEALRITAAGMKAGIEIIRASTIGEDHNLYLDEKPLTSERVRGEINATLVKLGAMPSHTIVAGGEQGADPHEEGSGPLKAHQAIIIDIFPRVEKSGYFGDMTRTVCRGEAPERLKKMWHTVFEGQELGFSLVKHHASGGAIHQKITDLFTEKGFPTGLTDDGRQCGFFHGTGHGLGLEIHESPRISTADQTLLSGHVVTVEPGLYYPDFGGVRIEDVVLVEKEGCRILSHFPKFLEV
ncbi:M24 family metallopeptidase [Magnetococcales bacterium HHB-1]